MKVFITGISASGRQEYCDAAVAFGEKHKKKIKLYELGNMLREEAKCVGTRIQWKNVLNAHDSVLNALKAAVFNGIMGHEGEHLQKTIEKHDAVIISAHACFYWNECFSDALDFSHLKAFAPDMFVTFIDGSADILDRLTKREQWQHQRLTSKDILVWQNVEVLLTRAMARAFGKPHYVVASAQPLATFHNLMFYPDVEKVYVSMPITHLKKKEDQDKVLAFISELNKYFVVFNPLAVDMAMQPGEEKMNLKGFIIESAEHTHTVMRDLEWQLEQSDKNVVYFPRIVSSPGVIDERHEAFRNTQDVWVIHPKHASPFMTTFKTAPELFPDPEAFFAFLKNNYFKGKKPELIYSSETYESYNSGK